MIPFRIKVQVGAFVVVALLGISYVGATYVGLTDTLFNRTYQVRAQFERGGGIFTNAAVTYRGVQVGKVSSLNVVTGGVEAGLRLTRDIPVPTNARAVVTNRSGVGEQYIDLRPAADRGPYLTDGSVISRRNTGTPLPVETLLVNLNKLVESVDQDDLTVVIDELGQAFDGAGSSLDRLVGSGNLLLADAEKYLPETIQLLRDSRTVLNTQVASGSSIRSWAASLASLSRQLRTSDPDLRKVITDAPATGAELTALVRQLRPTLGFLLANVLTVEQVQLRRLGGLEQILTVYPGAVAGGYTVAPGDGTAHFGLALNFDDPPPCRYVAGSPLTCSDAERQNGSSVRGWQNSPGPTGRNGDAGPADESPDPDGPPGQVSLPPLGADPNTGQAMAADGSPYVMGSTGGQQRVLGDQAWKGLLLRPLTG